MKGIDVSSYQGTIDWRKAKGDGVNFAVLKIIMKNGQPDKQFENNYAGCRENGIPAGVYNYSYATSVEKAESDARRVLEVLAGRSVQYRVWMDVEDVCQQGLGSLLVRMIQAYQSVIEAAGYEFGVYTGLYFYNTYLRPFGASLTCPFWIARYPTGRQMPLKDEPAENKIPEITHTLWGWQYTSSGKVAGITGPVDLDILYAEPAEQPKRYYLEEVFGDSIVRALESIGEDGSYARRERIAAANGIGDYKGTAEQNILLLELLRIGKLIQA